MAVNLLFATPIYDSQENDAALNKEIDEVEMDVALADLVLLFFGIQIYIKIYQQ